MGMSASQARFLCLTARKTNVEYEGQQINQQRTALSNESSNYYSQLASMTVPTPPSSADYYKITYTFENGTEKNTITSLIATSTTKDDGIYMLNYVQQIPCNTMVPSGNNVISKIPYDANNPNNDLYYYSLNGGNAYTYAIGTSHLFIACAQDDVTIESSVEANPDAFRNRFEAMGINRADVEKLSSDELINKLKLEREYRDLAIERYGQDDWLVRYQKNSATGNYEPVYYNAKELADADRDDVTSFTLGGMKAYVYGQSTTTKEIKNVQAKVEQDSSGRYINVSILDSDGNPTTYALTTSTEADEAAYNDAMNQYFYDKAVYDKQVQDINAKIEVIQVQDKNLELKLKQLDTEENAISTELDAVKKVISKNVESSFKTFNA